MELNLPPKPQPVVGPGEFQFAAVGLEHGHIYGMTNGLLEAGATLTAVWDEDPEKVAAYRRTFPQARAAASLDELLADPDIQLIASAAIPSERCPLGLRVMAAGKDYFVDKAPMTSLPQLEAARRAVAETGRKYMVYYSERLHSEAATLADYLIKQNTIGRVLHVEGFGPHRLGGPRPAWFYEKARYGGILCDIGSHQLEQLLYFAGVENADITFARKPKNARHGGVFGFRRMYRHCRQRRERVFSGRLVHARRPAQLGRWPDVHHRHRRLHRTAQVHRPGRRRKAGEHGLLG